MSVKIPSGSMEQMIRAELKSGKTPEEAVRAVLTPFGEVLRSAGNDALVPFARPSVLATARRLHRQLTRRAEDKAFTSAPGSRDRLHLGTLEFHVPGTKEVVSWAEATASQHDARIAWLHTYIGSLETDLRRHERARKLLENRGAQKLAEIEGWEALIGDDADGEDEDELAAEDASGEVVP